MSPKLKKIAAHFGVRLQRHRTRDDVLDFARAQGSDTDVWGVHYRDRVIHYSPELAGSDTHEVAHLLEAGFRYPESLDMPDYGLGDVGDIHDRESDAERIQVLLMACTGVGARNWRRNLDALGLPVPVHNSVWEVEDHGGDFEPDTLKMLPYRYIDFRWDRKFDAMWSGIRLANPLATSGELQRKLWEWVLQHGIGNITDLDRKVLVLVKELGIVKPMGNAEQWDRLFDRI